MPHPPGHDSNLRMNSGLRMSKKRNKINAHNKYFTWAGKNKRLMHIPATSSITTREGSLPQIGTTMPDDQTPANVIKTVITAELINGGYAPLQARYQQMQQASAATVPPPLPI